MGLKEVDAEKQLVVLWILSWSIMLVASSLRHSNSTHSITFCEGLHWHTHFASNDYYHYYIYYIYISLLMFSGPHLWFVFLSFVLLINILVQSQVCRSKRHVLLLKIKVTSTHSPRTFALTLTTLMLSQLLMQTVVTFSGPAAGVTGGYHSKKCHWGKPKKWWILS